MKARLAGAAMLWMLPLLAQAHSMMLTQVVITFDGRGSIDVALKIDLTQLLGSPERYYEFDTEPPETRARDLEKLLPRIAASVEILVGSQPLALRFRDFVPATADRAAYTDGYVSVPSTLRFTAALPAFGAPLRLFVPEGAPVDYPVAYTFAYPAVHSFMTRWLEEGMHESDPYVWADKASPGGGATAAATSAASAPTPAASFDPDTLPLGKQAALYLRLGFRHIVPEGADHILFVLGLFFLGVTWRKLLSQTTVFTVAHATTLFLSTYGIFRLPSRFVEPAIALSIAWIAIENVLKPRLGAGRLALVFGFGLVHGLGFASSLSEIPFPKRDFLVALLGFNFGVDFGQLFVIGIAFLTVGWFRNEPWFRARIAIPCSLLIAAVGAGWAVQRVIHYYG